MGEVCWDLVRSGNKNEIDKTVEQFYKVAYKIAHWWAKTGKIEESEAIGLANIAIMKCVTRCSYDETRGIKFSTYLGTAVNNEIRMFLRKEKKRTSNICASLDQPLPQYGHFRPHENITYADSILDDKTLEDCLEDKILFDEAYFVLSEASNEMSHAELKCIILSFLGCSIKDISLLIGRSQNHTRKILCSAHDKLREKYNEINYVEGAD